MRVALSSIAVALAIALSSTAIHAAPSSTFFTPYIPGQYVQYPSNTPIAPLHSYTTAEHLPGRYIVILNKGITTTDFLTHQALIQSAVTKAAAHHHQSSSSHSDEPSLNHIYDIGSRLQGYSGTFPDDLVQWIRAQPEVAYVERDQVVRTTVLPDDGSKVYDAPYDLSFDQLNALHHQKLAIAQQPPAPAAGGDDLGHLLQKNATWGLARISHRKPLGFGNFKQYLYDGVDGEGVTVYIVDTGINIAHHQFEGRARWGKTMPSGDTDTDGNGHGTHCAGTIGSRDYGVAKKAQLVAVKVLGSGGSGTMADVTAGVSWAAKNATELSAQYAANPHSAEAQAHKGFVASMSLGGGNSRPLNDAVNAAVEAGLHFSVAAGNENSDACNVSPAGAQNPITVGASTVYDERAYFSNKGKCVDVFAPGLNILSTWNTGPDSVNTISGTSMATPHIAGLIAYLLSIYGKPEFGPIKAALAEELHATTSKASSTAAFSSSASSSSWLTSYASKLSSVLHLPSIVFDALNDWFGLSREPNFELVRSAAAAAGGKDDEIQSALAPLILKKALTHLATPDILTDIDEDTVNLLAFNNATASASK